jgi:hypothetical protein
MRSSYCFAAAAAFVISAFQTMPALAQTRVFVAAQGSDANPCSFALPCRTFQHAHDTVVAGGEIDVLDPAGYGGLTISKAISIQGHGYAGISIGSSSIGITVSAGASDVVNLNGLLIEGNGVGVEGIFFSSGGSLVIENCVVRNMTTHGLILAATASTTRMLTVSKSYFADNGNFGIDIVPAGSGSVLVAIDRTALYGNGFGGMTVDGTIGTGAINVAVTDSVSEQGSGGPGFAAISASGHSVTQLTLTRITAANNTIGVQAVGTNATISLTQSTITGNSAGFFAGNNGTIVSFGDNTLTANGSSTGSLTPGTKQ